MNESGRRPMSLMERPKTDGTKSQFLRETWSRRNLDLLLRKIVEFMDQQGFPPAEVREQLQKEKPLLVSLFGDSDHGLKRDLLFHGTGKDKYAGEKYTDGASHEEISPVLDTILNEGLAPQYDPWAREGEMNSTSVAKNYFYSKYYANRYESDPGEIRWQFGDPKDWLYYFMFDIVKAAELKDVAAYLKTKVKKGFQKKQVNVNKFAQWAQSLRNDINGGTTFKDLMEGRSTIADNFGAVLCIDSVALPVLRPKIIGAHEVRVDQAVPPSRIKAIGVPLVRTTEAQDMVRNAGLDTPVFSFESAELYLSQFRLEELTERF